MKRFFANYGRYLLFAIVYPVVWDWLFGFANVYWFPPAGWRFIAYLLLPLRWWWLPTVVSLIVWQAMGAEIPREVTREVLFALPILWLKHGDAGFNLRSNRDAWRLLGAMSLSGMAGAVLFFNFWFPFAMDADLVGKSKVDLFVQFVSGDLNGMLLLVPLLLMLVKQRPNKGILRHWRFDVPCVLLPSLALYVLAAFNASAPTYVFATVLCILPVMYFAFRSGWRGMAIAFPPASVAIATCSHYVGVAIAQPAQVQFLLCIGGAGALLLGAANDSLHERQQELRQRNRELQAMTAELHEAARRNLDLSEDVRRWITAELHDEVGQNLTALQTRLMLVERRSGDTEMLQPVWDIISGLRHKVSGLMSSLRPASLDELGLRQTLEHGQIRTNVEQAGLRFDLRIDDEGDVLDALGDPMQTALYRIVQEAATNVLRHANARTFRVHLRGKAGGRIALYVADDGGGIIHPHKTRKSGIGLQGIRDRVLALGGRLRLRSDGRGTRLLVRFHLS